MAEVDEDRARADLTVLEPLAHLDVGFDACDSRACGQHPRIADDEQIRDAPGAGSTATREK
ncbi:MAG: hypothetical protein ACHP7B_05205 [Burkholderiales bacterium]|jgi:hypothetical protein